MKIITIWGFFLKKEDIHIFTGVLLLWTVGLVNLVKMKMEKEMRDLSPFGIGINFHLYRSRTTESPSNLLV